MVNITVDSEYYTRDDEMIQIIDYYATRVNESSIDIQLEFLHPQAVTLSVKDPDFLMI